MTVLDQYPAVMGLFRDTDKLVGPTELTNITHLVLSDLTFPTGC